MAHPQQQRFCTSIKDRFPIHFTSKNVLDCGSLDINGNNRYLFNNCEYLGIDVGSGKNVDIVIPIHEFNHPDESFDTIISTECFEHDMYYEKSLKNICRLLKSGGLFLFTCATIGRPEHGTIRTTPENSPLTSNISEWSNYYKNLEESDIRNAINIEEIFSVFEFSIKKSLKDPDDLYFWGIKKK
jgi:SAM-dependent methyltransferase